ncbi:ABC transporter type 1, transmembrane domain-containing protein [Hypoxylon cercidicola]|nr:ABC transporter type 1, transmembrane domain-containing protein [Hypoxylon cercidicola]
MLFWAYPLSLYLGYVASRIYQAIQARGGTPLQAQRKSSRTNTIFLTFHVAFCSSITATAVVTLFLIRKSSAAEGWMTKDYLSSTIAVGLFYLAALLPDPDHPYTVSDVQWHMWLISTVYETAWLAYNLTVVQSLEGGCSYSALDIAQVTLSALRTLFLLCSIGIYWALTVRPRGERSTSQDEESSLLPGERGSNNVSYGIMDAKAKGDEYAKAGDAQTTTWLDYMLGFGNLFPFLWPSDSKRLRVRAVFCFFLLVVQRAINILTPHQLGVVVASLGSGKLPHAQILLYVLFRGLQGQQGVIGSTRALLWIPISQSTYRRLSTATFKHVLELSLDFHLSKRVGEVMSALSKGGALNTFLDGFVFQLFPMVADLWIAAAYFFFKFDAFYSLMVIAVTWFYIYITIYMAKYRGRARREMVRREREMEAAKTNALLSYETVHNSGAVPIITKASF